MEQMQLRESLHALPGDESALTELEALKKDVSEKFQDRQQKFAHSYQNNMLQEAKKIFHEMQFLNKLLAEIDSGEEQRLGY